MDLGLQTSLRISRINLYWIHKSFSKKKMDT